MSNNSGNHQLFHVRAVPCLGLGSYLELCMELLVIFSFIIIIIIIIIFESFPYQLELMDHDLLNEQQYIC